MLLGKQIIVTFHHFFVNATKCKIDGKTFDM